MLFCIVDDHQLLGQLLRRILIEAYPGAVVKLFINGQQFINDDFKNGPPAVVITDVLLPDGNGIEIALKQKERLPGAKFIVLTTLIDVTLAKMALRRGLNGYITKDAPEQEVIEGIKAVLQGEKYISHTLKENMVKQLFNDDEVDYNISAREMEILVKLCEGKTPKETAELLNLSIHTVNQHIKSMLGKLKLNRTTDLVLFAINHRLYTTPNP